MSSVFLLCPKPETYEQKQAQCDAKILRYEQITEHLNRSFPADHKLNIVTAQLLEKAKTKKIQNVNDRIHPTGN